MIGVSDKKYENESDSLKDVLKRSKGTKSDSVHGSGMGFGFDSDDEFVSKSGTNSDTDSDVDANAGKRFDDRNGSDSSLGFDSGIGSVSSSDFDYGFDTGADSVFHSLKSMRFGFDKKKVLIVAGVLAIVLCGAGFAMHKKKPSLKEGNEVLAKLEQRNLDEINAQVREAKTAEMNAQIANGSDGIGTLMADAVVVGDSRAEAFGSYGFMPSDRVLAGIGDTILKIEEWKDSVAALRPSVIYVSYGPNDLTAHLGSDDGPDGYGKLLEKQIDGLLEVDPGATIAINSIMLPTPEKQAAEEWWANTDDYNRQIRELCERRGWVYVDNDALADGGNAAIYEPDGEHFVPGFYPIWAQNMAMQVMNAAK